MANWNLPTITSNYLDFVSEMNVKFSDTAQMFGVVNATGIPIGTIRLVRHTAVGTQGGYNLDEFDGSNFQAKILSVSGGGTGSNNPAGIRVNLGLGSMSTQNSNAVAITGGTITGVTFNAGDITGGVLGLASGGTGASLAVGNNGWLLLSNGAVTHWAPGVNIPQLSASALVTGTVPLAAMPGQVAYKQIDTQIFVGRQQFNNELISASSTGLYSFTAYTRYPAINFYDPIPASGLRVMRIMNLDGNMEFQSVNDAYTSAITLMRIRNNGFMDVNGRNIIDLNANNISMGYVNTARLGDGVANSTTFLRGDYTWAVPSGSGGGAPIPFPSGMISMFATSCPAGWTRVSGFDGRFPLGSTVYNQSGGNNRHSHSFSVNSTTEGNHSHSFSGGLSGSATGNVSGTTGAGNGVYETLDAGDDHSMPRGSHGHDFNVSANLGLSGSASGETSQAGNHYHQVYGNTSEDDQYPPYLTVVFCQKD